MANYTLEDVRGMGAVKTYTLQDVQAMTNQSGMGDSIKQGAGNTLAGLVRGAGSIGATLLAPIDIAKDAISGKGLSLESNRQRRSDMDSALASMGAETDSFGYGAGKLTGEVLGTAGAGGSLFRPVDSSQSRTNCLSKLGGFLPSA